MIDIETTNSCESTVIASLLVENQELKNRIKDFSSLIIEKDDLVTKLAKENNKLKNRISELNRELECASRDIDELEEIVEWRQS